MSVSRLTASGAVLALVLGRPLAAQVTGPDLRSCTPRDFEQQSGIPMAAAFIDVAEGLAIGREGSGAPFVASAQLSLLSSFSSASRRWALGPVGGLSYANPKLHGM